MVTYFLLWVVFNNMAGSPELQTGWGYGAWIVTDSQIILFDTGNDGKILLENLKKLKLDPKQVDAVVISHAHWDHVGGLADFLKAAREGTPVYVPAGALEELRDQFPGARFTPVDDTLQIAPGVWTTGQMVYKGRDTRIFEQALVVNTTKGLVVVTGCSHPGIAAIVEQAHRMFPQIPIHLAGGGFHMMRQTDAQIMETVNAVKALGVEHVSPSHCTGDRAVELFREAWGEDFLDLSLGSRFEVGKK